MRSIQVSKVLFGSSASVSYTLVQSEVAKIVIECPAFQLDHEHSSHQTIQEEDDLLLFGSCWIEPTQNSKTFLFSSIPVQMLLCVANIKGNTRAIKTETRAFLEDNDK